MFIGQLRHRSNRLGEHLQRVESNRSRVARTPRPSHPSALQSLYKMALPSASWLIPTEWAGSCGAMATVIAALHLFDYRSGEGWVYHVRQSPPSSFRCQFSSATQERILIHQSARIRSSANSPRGNLSSLTHAADRRRDRSAPSEMMRTVMIESQYRRADPFARRGSHRPTHGLQGHQIVSKSMLSIRDISAKAWYPQMRHRQRGQLCQLILRTGELDGGRSPG